MTITVSDKAERELIFGNVYPYDETDAWWQGDGADPSPPIDWAHSATRAVIRDLKDRRGIKHGFNNVDEDIRKEIVSTLAEIIRTAAQEETFTKLIALKTAHVVLMKEVELFLETVSEDTALYEWKGKAVIRLEQAHTTAQEGNYECD